MTEQTTITETLEQMKGVKYAEIVAGTLNVYVHGFDQAHEAKDVVKAAGYKVTRFQVVGDDDPQSGDNSTVYVEFDAVQK